MCAARSTRAAAAGREAGLESHTAAVHPLQRASAGFFEVLLFKKGRCSEPCLKRQQGAAAAVAQKPTAASDTSKKLFMLEWTVPPLCYRVGIIVAAVLGNVTKP